MAIDFARIKLETIFTHRCFYLFVALLLLIAAAPFLTDNRNGRIAGNIVNIFVLLAGTAAVSRSNVAFLISCLIGLLTVGFQVLAFALDELRYLPISWMFAAGFYVVTVCYLLRYVLSPSVLDIDKLYGCAAVYLMLGVLWAYLYAIAQHFFPGANAAGGNAVDPRSTADLLYYSFSVQTTTGFGDIVPVLAPARSLTMLQEAIGVLYISILIARLAGIYSHERDQL
jgi:hypothetical protein